MADLGHMRRWALRRHLEAEPGFGYLVDVLNVSPGLSALLLAGWLGEL